MARYDQWRKLSGDTSNTELLDAGKKLLGHLAEQRSLSGNKTMFAHAALADGSTIEAKFLGDIPVLRIKDGGGKNAESLVKNYYIEGIVIKPRKIGTAAANDGDNYFGTNAQRLINGKYNIYDNGSRWASKEAAEVTTNKERVVIMPSGLVSSGYPTTGASASGVKYGGCWYSADESIAITWADRAVFRNGNTIWSVAANHFIRAAAMREQEDGKLYLMVAEQYSGSMYVYSVEMAPDIAVTKIPVNIPLKFHPAWGALAKGDILDASFVLDGTFNSFLTQAVFNSTATELRVLHQGQDFVNVLPEINDPIFTEYGQIVRRVLEYVVDTSTNVLSVTTIDHGLTGTYDHSRTTANAVGLIVTNELQSSQAPVTPPPGGGVVVHTYDIFYIHNTLDDLLRKSNEAWQYKVTPLNTNPIPIYVGYEDDVPVYLMAQYLGEAITTETITTSITTAPTYDIAGWTRYDAGGVGVESEGYTNTGDTMDWTASATMVASSPGIRYYARDKNNVLWFDTTSCTHSSSRTASHARHGEWVTNSVNGPGEGPGSTYATSSASFTNSGVSSTTSVSDVLYIQAIDLRTRSLIMRRDTISDTCAYTFSGPNGSISGDHPGFATPHIYIPFSYTTHTRNNDWSQTTTHDTYIWAYGELVRSFTGTNTTGLSETYAGTAAGEVPNLYDYVVPGEAFLHYASETMNSATGGPLSTKMYNRVGGTAEQTFYGLRHPAGASEVEERPVYNALVAALDADTFYADYSATIPDSSPPASNGFNVVVPNFYESSSEEGSTYAFAGSQAHPRGPAFRDTSVSTTLLDSEVAATYGIGSGLPQFVVRGGKWTYNIPSFAQDAPVTAVSSLGLPVWQATSWIAEASCKSPDFPSDYNVVSAHANLLDPVICGGEGAQLIGKLWPLSPCYYGHAPL